MPCQRSLLTAAFSALAVLIAPVEPTFVRAQQSSASASAARSSVGQKQEIRLLFTGDILLSRQVAAEIRLKNQAPWASLGDVFRSADWVGGNLEGAVGNASTCVGSSEQSPCFDVDASLLRLASAAGFTALGNENNHAGDLGVAGRESTRQALAAKGLLPLTFAASPEFLRFGATTVALISLSTVPDRQGRPDELPSIALQQKLRLARALANVVVVSIHWGGELLEWPNDQQRSQARWLVAHGADVIIGHHPHVVQMPECVSGKPVFFSLGNHVFDQKYPATKEGLIADCQIRGERVVCGALRTHTPVASSFPEGAADDPAADQALAACTVQLRPTLTVSGFALRPQPSSPADTPGDIWIEGFVPGSLGGQRAWRTRPAPVLSLEVGSFEGASGPPFLLSIERHASPIDSEVDPRPYVYEVGPHGFTARWRGSALAWPLLDARLLPRSGGVLCALHRRDSFLVLSPESKGTRVAAYRWNGFGFDGITDPGIISQCHAILDEEIAAAPQSQP